MFNIDFEYDKKKEIYTFSGWTGFGFKRVLRRVLNERKLNNLFIKVSLKEVSFYSFFALEVRAMFKKILDGRSRYETNLEFIEEMIEILNTKSWLNKNSHRPIILDYKNMERNLRYKILPHQKDAFDFYTNIKGQMSYRGGLLAADPGTGKTFMGLAIAEALNADRIIIVSPLPAIEKVWTESVVNSVYRQVQDIYGINDIKRKWNGEKIVLMHYESINKFLNRVLEFKSKNSVLIIDESHNFNEIKSNRTDSLVTLAKELETDNIILLSGTPIKVKALELIPMLRILDKRFTPVVEKRFETLYKSSSSLFSEIISQRYKEYHIKIVKESMNLPDLYTEYIDIKIKNGKDYTLDSVRNEMKKYVTERTKEIEDNMESYLNNYDTYLRIGYEGASNESLTNESELIEYKNQIDMIVNAYRKGTLMEVNEMMILANNYEKNVILPFLSGTQKSDFREAKSIKKYLSLKIRGEVLGRVFMKKRMECHRDMAKTLDYKHIKSTTTKKVLAFSNYIEVLDAGYDKAKNQKLNPLGVYGPVTKRLPQIVSSFVKEPKHKILFASLMALSTAVPIIVANVVIFLDVPFRTYMYSQAVARAHRLGQDKPVTVYNIRLDTGEELNLNSRGIDILSWSKEMVESITGSELGIDIPESLKELPQSEDSLGAEDMASFLVQAKTDYLDEERKTLSW